MKITYSFFLDRAIEYATEKHKGQTRKNTRADPYITHPLEVMRFLLNHGVEDDEILSTAVLHDVVEDTDATHNDVLMHFGKRVSDMVREVSDDKTLPKADRKRKQVEDMSDKSLGARVTKIADKWSNTRELLTDPPVGWDEDRVMAYIVWAEEVYARAVAPGDIPPKMVEAMRQHFVDLGTGGVSAKERDRLLATVMGSA
jgi:guanosine-3',5'-bis(diphosphate) 3'-pyrophosphohydrolase